MSNLAAIAKAIDRTTQDLRLLNDEMELDAQLRKIGVGERKRFIGKCALGLSVVLKINPDIRWTLKQSSQQLNGSLLESGGILCVVDDDDWTWAPHDYDPMHADQSRYSKAGVRRSWAGD